MLLPDGVDRQLGAEHAGLDLTDLAAAQPRREVVVRGDPPVRSRIEGGLAGDAATVGLFLAYPDIVLWLPRAIGA